MNGNFYKEFLLIEHRRNEIIAEALSVVIYSYGEDEDKRKMIDEMMVRLKIVTPEIIEKRDSEIAEEKPTENI